MKSTPQIPDAPSLPVQGPSIQPSERDIRNLEHLVNAIQALGLEEFIEYIKSPWKLLWPNFIAGMARGFGALVGATIVIGIVGWILTTIIDIPLIGKKLEPFVQNVQSEFKKYTEATNYKPYFESMEESLKRIEANTKPGLQ